MWVESLSEQERGARCLLARSHQVERALFKINSPSRGRLPWGPARTTRAVRWVRCAWDGLLIA